MLRTETSEMIAGRQRTKNGQIQFGEDSKETRVPMFVELSHCIQWPGVEGKLERLSPGMEISKRCGCRPSQCTGVKNLVSWRSTEQTWAYLKAQR